MNQYKFKTNINCGGCVARLTPVFNQNEEIKDWKVDTGNPNKILTVETDSLDEEAIKTIVLNAGFKAENLV